MASTYYKMSEVMDKLRKSEPDVQELIKQGKLRQYMDAGKPVFKVDEVDKLAEEIVGLELTSGGSEIELKLDETGEIELVPDDDIKPKESEGGFGLSQLGDLTSADTKVGTVGLNILSGTEDAYKLTEDTRAETRAGDAEDVEGLGSDANLESFGSGSGLLDLSLQADDTSLGAVLDDILPTAADGAGEIAAEPLADEDALVGQAEEELASPAAKTSGQTGIAAGFGAGAAPQLVAIVPEDPASNMYGVMMFLPVLAMVMTGIVLTAALRDVNPAITKLLTESMIAGVSMIWYIIGGLAVAVLIIWGLTATSGSKKAKPAKDVYEKKPKKKK